MKKKDFVNGIHVHVHAHPFGVEITSHLIEKKLKQRPHNEEWLFE